MSENLIPLDDRTEELLSLLVTQGLDADQQREFEAIDWQSLGTDKLSEVQRFENAAAAFAIAFEDCDATAEPISADLMDRLNADANSFFRQADQASITNELASSSEPIRVLPTTPTNPMAPPSWREALALFAAAACLAILLIRPTGTETPEPVPLAQQMAVLVDSNPVDLVSADWTQVHDKNATGRVVWSDLKQEGYMVFNNLPVNDPTKEQYQLWVFDTSADQAHPVDGGVFDINSNGEVIVPIDVRVPVDKAVMFAVTVEKPGGVVVSKREKIPVLAKVE